jgi:hypothetical protein
MSRSDATGPYVKSVALLQELEAAGGDEWRGDVHRRFVSFDVLQQLARLTYQSLKLFPLFNRVLRK